MCLYQTSATARHAPGRLKLAKRTFPGLVSWTVAHCRLSDPVERYRGFLWPGTTLRTPVIAASKIYIKRNKNIKNLFCVGMSIMNISLDCPPPSAIKCERRNALRGSARGKECFDHQFKPQFRVYWGFRHSCRLHSPTVWMKYCWRNGFLYALLVCDSFTTRKDWEWIILGNKSSWSYCGEQCTGLGSCEGKDSSKLDVICRQ